MTIVEVSWPFPEATGGLVTEICTPCGFQPGLRRCRATKEELNNGTEWNRGRNAR